MYLGVSCVSMYVRVCVSRSRRFFTTNFVPQDKGGVAIKKRSGEVKKTSNLEKICPIASEALRERKMKVRVYPWRQRQWRRSPLPSRCQKCHSLQSSDPCRPPSSAPQSARVSKMNSSCLNKLFRADMFTAFCWKFQLRENS